ncbi:MAG TPA: molybdopterin converting factor subunit 1 [Geminicoccus sp.]|jgi:molybdopterin synthase sulfur carrier subunit|uniref:molybdopterin converting factor subunit 1 n=1 Tax=Geminicoccus sp. TaxID=2024832 RepID=UPI002E346421|nr:molybdopterin converting factor subunit 1 [Geminicoccus sp.]HEX2525454.1 molybdopterin converting factor subunit 1 [Geminicoccus sp.]
MKIMYFAWLRQKAGTSSETIELPPGVGDVGGLLDFLAARHPAFGEAVASQGIVRCAVNQRHVQRDHPVGPDDEVAFFPPVTGG